MYADDTAICVSASNKAGVTKLMQDDLINVNDWLCANRLSLHIGKTSCMLVTSAQRRRRMSHDHLDLSLNDNQIEHDKASPYVGITIDQNLNFNIQTNNICNKANRALAALKRAAPFLPIDTRALMFNTMVLSQKTTENSKPWHAYHLAMSPQDTYRGHAFKPKWLSNHTQIRSLPEALDSGISYQHPFELSQTSRH